MRPIYINKKDDLKDLDNIKNLVLNNNNNYFIQKLNISNINIIRILIKFFLENYKNKLEAKK